MKKFALLMLLVLVLVASVILLSPYWTIYQLQQAYEQKNVSAINAHLDFAALRLDINRQLTDSLQQKLQRINQSPILQAIGLQIGSEKMLATLVDQAVDNTVTEQGVANLINTEMRSRQLDNHAKLLLGLMGVAMDKVDIKTLITARNQDELAELVTQQLTSPSPYPTTIKNTAKYCGFNCFDVQTQIHGYPVTINMQRKGLVNWQIVGVKLPF